MTGEEALKVWRDSVKFNEVECSSKLQEAISVAFREMEKAKLCIYPKEITFDDVLRYCKPRCLEIVSGELLYRLTHHEVKTSKQTSYNDCISREAVLDIINEVCFSREQKWVEFRYMKGTRGQIAFIIESIESLPSNQPDMSDEKTICTICKYHRVLNGKYECCYAEKGCPEVHCGGDKKKCEMLDEEQESVLNKIRAEIENAAFDWQEIDGEHNSFMVVELTDALDIIDNYRKESEEK